MRPVLDCGALEISRVWGRFWELEPSLGIFPALTLLGIISAGPGGRSRAQQGWDRSGTEISTQKLPGTISPNPFAAPALFGGGILAAT